MLVLMLVLIGVLVLKTCSEEMTVYSKCPKCCHCNSNGRCQNYCCVRSGSACFNCLPLHQGHCENCVEPEEDLSPQPTMSSIQHDIDVSSFSEDESELFSLPDESAAVDGLVSEFAESD